MHREILDNENGSHTSVIHLVHYLFVAVSSSICGTPPRLSCGATSRVEAIPMQAKWIKLDLIWHIIFAKY